MKKDYLEIRLIAYIAEFGEYKAVVHSSGLFTPNFNNLKEGDIINIDILVMGEDFKISDINVYRVEGCFYNVGDTCIVPMKLETLMSVK